MTNETQRQERITELLATDSSSLRSPIIHSLSTDAQQCCFGHTIIYSFTLFHFVNKKFNTRLNYVHISLSIFLSYEGLECDVVHFPHAQMLYAFIDRLFSNISFYASEHHIF